MEKNKRERELVRLLRWVERRMISRSGRRGGLRMTLRVRGRVRLNSSKQRRRLLLLRIPTLFPPLRLALRPRSTPITA
jgi:hypothetical protein